MFFAFFILTDPPTSPTKPRDQVVCGSLVAIVSVVTYLALGVVFYLLAGMLVGNLHEAWRRAALSTRRQVAAAYASWRAGAQPQRVIAPAHSWAQR